MTIVGKANDLHVREVLETSLEENLAMIADSVRYLKSKGKGVFFDAEHFFDGFAADRDYALSCLRAANAGVDGLVLCDTNGGTLTPTLLGAIEVVQRGFPTSTSASTATTTPTSPSRTRWRPSRRAYEQVQACINGYGERCGNANMCSVIAGLKLKLGRTWSPTSSWRA